MASKVVFALLSLAVAAYGQTHLPFGFNPTQASFGIAPSQAPFGIAPSQSPFGLSPSAIPRFAPRYGEEEYAPAQYKFQYDINAPETGDIKNQQEERNGNNLRGSYSFIQPDGLRRIVEYSDEGAGFVAIVRYENAGFNAPTPQNRYFNAGYDGLSATIAPQFEANTAAPFAFRFGGRYF